MSPHRQVLSAIELMATRFNARMAGHLNNRTGSARASSTMKEAHSELRQLLRGAERGWDLTIDVEPSNGHETVLIGMTYLNRQGEHVADAMATFSYVENASQLRLDYFAVVGPVPDAKKPSSWTTAAFCAMNESKDARFVKNFHYAPERLGKDMASQIDGLLQDWIDAKLLMDFSVQDAQRIQAMMRAV